MPKKHDSRVLGLLLIFTATAGWSTAGVWVKLVVEGSGVSPIDLAFWRDFVTFLVLVAGLALFKREWFRINRRDLPWLALMGSIGIGVFHVLWNLSVLMNGAAIATVLQYNAPILVTLAARILWKESLNWQKLLAIFLAVSGTLLIALPSATGIQITTIGLLVGLSSAAANSIFSLVGKHLTGSYSPWTVMTYIFGFGMLTLFPLALFTGGPWTLTPQVVVAFAGFIFFPTLGGFGLYTMGLQKLPASVAAIIATTEVPLAAIVAYLVLGERLDGVQWAGMLLVMTGVALISMPLRWLAALKGPRAASGV
jgi:drug/metabolite transporter (DMT)-like permease